MGQRYGASGKRRKARVAEACRVRVGGRHEKRLMEDRSQMHHAGTCRAIKVLKPQLTWHWKPLKQFKHREDVFSSTCCVKKGTDGPRMDEGGGSGRWVWTWGQVPGIELWQGSQPTGDNTAIYGQARARGCLPG